MAACTNRDNLVSNGDFSETDANDGAADWSVIDSDEGTFFTVVDSSAQFISTNESLAITLSQSLTLCPQSLYTLSARVGQESILSQCNAEFAINGRLVFAVQPTTRLALSTGSYYSGVGLDAAGLDLTITVACDGTPDADGNFVLNVDDVGLVLAT